ncbi:MAG: hypothetical protein AAFX76_04840 [Planctomycetota bacterium]
METNANDNKWANRVAWALQVGVAVLFLQTLFFKLTYAPATQVIFGDIGGRAAATFTALVELVVALLLLPGGAWVLGRVLPAKLAGLKTAAPAVGALLAIGVLGGAIVTHLAVIGVVLPVAPGSEATDGGSLFAMAVGMAVASAVVLVLRRDRVKALIATLSPSGEAAAVA